jgi:hypothetical protein
MDLQWHAKLSENSAEFQSCLLEFLAIQPFGGKDISAERVGNRKRVAIFPVSQSEFPFKVSTPHFIAFLGIKNGIDGFYTSQPFLGYDQAIAFDNAINSGEDRKSVV